MLSITNYSVVECQLRLDFGLKINFFTKTITLSVMVGRNWIKTETFKHPLCYPVIVGDLQKIIITVNGKVAETSHFPTFFLSIKVGL